MKPKFIVSVLFYFFSFGFILSILLGAFFLVMSIINLNDKNKSDFEPQYLHFENYISIYESGIPHVDYSYSRDSTIRYMPVMKEFNVEVKPNTPLAYYDVFFKLIYICFAITITWFSLKFFHEIKLDKPFNFRFIKYLKIIALLLISLDILKFVNSLIFNQFIHRSDLNPHFQFPDHYYVFSPGIIIGMSIWILAIIFQRGVELQNENDLTV